MKRLIGFGAASAVIVVLAVLGIATASASPPDDLRAAKAASARYHSIQQAFAAGYVQGSPCEQIPGLGGMGFHYVNPPLLEDPALDPLRPEILLYAPKPNGRLELVGVEYFKVDADQNLETDDDRPFMFGQPFDGPMLGHAPGMPIHYDLHVWFWRDNPSGLFAPWNPRVVCPAP
jgi:hypothetical protein